MNLEFNPWAQDDIARAARYYARQRDDLDEEFLGEVDNAVRSICADPMRFEQFRPGIHRYLLNRFPYGVYYRLPTADTIRIIAVKHHRRRPGLGMRRT